MPAKERSCGTKARHVRGAAHFRAAVSLLIAFLLGLTALSCGGKGLSPDELQRVENAVERSMARNRVPGAIVGIRLAGWNTVIARGVADLSKMRTMAEADIFRVGDITKTFTVTVLLQLVDEGRVKLADPLAKYLPDIPNAGNITIRELCNMTSGLFDYTEDNKFQEMLERNPTRIWKPEELVASSVPHHPYSDPGEGFHCSNTNAVIAGMIIEKLTGRKLSEEIRDRITKKLGLSHTILPAQPEIKGARSHGYRASEDGLEDVTSLYSPTFVWASGAMVSNLDELQRWAAALAGGELLSDETQRQRLSRVDAEVAGLKIQYGLGIEEVKGFLGHTGDYPGYSSAMFHHPALDATIVVLLNKNPGEVEAPGLALFSEIAELLLASLKEE